MKYNEVINVYEFFDEFKQKMSKSLKEMSVEEIEELKKDAHLYYKILQLYKYVRDFEASGVLYYNKYHDILDFEPN